MTWVRIDDGFARHPKVVAAGPLAMAMQVAALCYCNRELTDGFVPRAVARTLLDWEGIALRCAEDEANQANGQASAQANSKQVWSNVDAGCVIGALLASGMWEEAPGGYLVHDFDDYQPSKAEVLELSQKRAEAGRIGGRRSAASRQANRASAQALAQANGKQVLKQNASKIQARIPYPVSLNDESSTTTSSGPASEPVADAPADANPADLYVTTLGDRFWTIANKFAELDPQLSKGWLRKTMREAATDKVRQPLGFEQLSEGMMNAYERVGYGLANGKRAGSPTGFARTIIFGALEEAAL